MSAARSANEVIRLMLTLIALGVFVLHGCAGRLRSFVLVRVSERFDSQLHGRATPPPSEKGTALFASALSAIYRQLSFIYVRFWELQNEPCIA
ncbi:hypothetical protein ABZQ32_10120 [Pseudomonas paraeruginosa]|uniref:Uncharacterized protein n=1 Tax=Pseudomonas paraeruginosa (strain DSM 24068 / PA7) TaxID=381754 RepID=A6V9N3_PSEP7|nr:MULTISPECIES: hypothetical protein [Pseudomonas aeruginosa group]ABR85106.2 hypothetical protein PSPA7_4417 [Pseudomonas aeruginosa PA7]MBH8713203.1 hypothetical protein [Pseudomonas aeruginosa]MBH9341084.1 hypothetical protein [Pseudomonas aeruginosa]MBH9395572.1 hypothetical protein [Pseudomonas aeruginosa]MBI8113948.1 hypothetical protein [Pseudomonas aeruginosa]